MKKKVKKVWLAKDNPSIQRIQEKCLDCGQCQNTCWSRTGINYQPKMVHEPICVNCGQCILTCPTGALNPQYDYKKVLNYLFDTDKIMIVSVAPAVRVAIGEEFGYPPGEFLEGQLVAALKEIGFNYVFDVTFGADLTVIEEANELYTRLKEKRQLPLFTSCCPAWVKYIEIFHPDLIPYLSTAKSPVAMQAAIIRTYFRRLKDLDPNNIINVIIVPCTAKKYEIKRPEVQGIDFALTTTELAMMIRECNIDFNNLKKEKFDLLLGKGSAAGLIFGRTSGVSEAVLRTLYPLFTNQKIPSAAINYQALKDEEKLKIAVIDFPKGQLKTAVVNGLINFEKLLPDINNYDFIEVMSCPEGCAGGGGQPLCAVTKTQEAATARSESLWHNSQNLQCQSSHTNPEILNVYRCFLGLPQSEHTQSMLHTTFSSQQEIFKNRKKS